MSTQELAALAALRNYVNAAVVLLDAWEKIGPFDVLTENIPDPESFIEFGEEIDKLFTQVETLKAYVLADQTYLAKNKAIHIFSILQDIRSVLY